MSYSFNRRKKVKQALKRKWGEAWHEKFVAAQKLFAALKIEYAKK